MGQGNTHGRDQGGVSQSTQEHFQERPAARFPEHFQYFPGDYRWSAEMLVVLSTVPFGGAEISEVDRVGRALRDKVGDDEAWFDEWVKGADLRMHAA